MELQYDVNTLRPFNHRSGAYPGLKYSGLAKLYWEFAPSGHMKHETQVLEFIQGLQGNADIHIASTGRKLLNMIVPSHRPKGAVRYKPAITTLFRMINSASGGVYIVEPYHVARLYKTVPVIFPVNNYWMTMKLNQYAKFLDQKMEEEITELLKRHTKKKQRLLNEMRNRLT